MTSHRCKPTGSSSRGWSQPETLWTRVFQNHLAPSSHRLISLTLKKCPFLISRTGPENSLAKHTLYLIKLKIADSIGFRGSSKSSEIPLALAMGRKGGANGVGRAFGVSCFVRTHETSGFSRGEKSSGVLIQKPPSNCSIQPSTA